jgi:hypothetical protein
MYSVIVLPFFLQYLVNAKNLISSWSIILKLTPMNPNNFIYIYMDLILREGYWEKKLFEADSSDIPW